MPQYNTPPLVTSIVAADILLIWQAVSSANKTITFDDFASSLASMIPHVDDVSIVTGNTTLNGSYQFIVGNSAGTFNITLPSAVAFPGQRYTIANKGAGTISVLASGTDAIAAGSLVVTTPVTQYNSYTFVSDGVDTWHRST